MKPLPLIGLCLPLLIAAATGLSQPAGPRPFYLLTAGPATVPERMASEGIAGFSATRTPDHDVVIAWSSENENAGLHFEIERSLDGQTWKTIAVALAGSSRSENGYEYVDRNIRFPALYYRIRQTDKDGRFSVSDSKKVERQTRVVTGFLLTEGNISIHLYGQVKNRLTIILTDQAGRLMDRREYKNARTAIHLDETGLEPGLYTVTIKDGLGLVSTRTLRLK